MKGEDCSRRWQAEAIEDGRLGELERLSFERHRAGCEVCAEEQRSLDCLRELGQKLPTDAPTLLERRRLRNEILRQADAITTGGAPPRQQRGLWGAAVLAAALAVVVWAPWTSRSEGIAANGKAVPVGSSRSAPMQALTTAPLKLAQLEPRSAASAGAESDAPKVAAARDHALSSAWVGAARKPRGAPIRWAQGANGRRSESPLPTGQGTHPEPDSSARAGAERAGQAFAQAYDAFAHGAYAVAEEQFLRFEQQYRTDTRVEDAAFLRAICRQRLGDRAGAARGADEYLRRFPDGFRRRDAESILVSH